MKEELERLRENHPKIQNVVLASRHTQITDQNSDLNKWPWQLRDAIDEADDVLDEFECMKLEKQLNKNKERTNLRSTKSSMKKESTKQEQQEQQEQLIELYKTLETRSLPKNDLICGVKDNEFVMQWLRKPSNGNETHITNTTFYGSYISLLSVVGLGGMGKITILQHVHENELTKKFDLKTWVCVSGNFDVKRVIADMLEHLKMNMPEWESLEALQRSLNMRWCSRSF